MAPELAIQVENLGVHFRRNRRVGGRASKTSSADRPAARARVSSGAAERQFRCRAR